MLKSQDTNENLSKKTKSFLKTFAFHGETTLSEDVSQSKRIIKGEDIVFKGMGVQPLDQTIYAEIESEKSGLGNMMSINDILNSKIPEYIVDATEEELIKKYAEPYPTVQAIITRVITAVLEMGIVFTGKNGKPMNLTPRFQNIVNKFYVRVVWDTIQKGYRTGLIPITIRMSKETNFHKVPYIPKSGYIITITVIRGSPFYKFYWVHRTMMRNGAFQNMYEYDDKVEIFEFPGGVPAETGALRSKLSSVVHDIEMYEIHKRNALIADTGLANPVNFTALNAEIAKNPDILVSTRAPYADAISGKEPNSTFVMESGLDTLKKIDLQLNDAMYGVRGALQEENFFKDDTEQDRQVSGSSLQNNPIDPAKRLANARQNLVPLSIGRTIERGTTPQMNSLLVDQAEELEKKIFNAFGIPKSILIHESTVRGNTQGQNKTFEDTVKMISELVGNILTAAYEKIYGTNDKEEVEQIVRSQIIADLINAINNEKYIMGQNSGFIPLQREPLSSLSKQKTQKKQLDSQDPIQDAYEMLRRKRKIAQKFQLEGTKDYQQYLSDETRALDRKVSDFLLKELLDDEIIKKRAEAAYEEVKIRVVLQAIPTVSPNLLVFAYLTGLITREKYAQMMLKLIGLKIDDLGEKEEILTDEEKQAILLGINYIQSPNETETTAMTQIKMDAKQPKKTE